MKKIIRFILYHSYDILIFIFLIYLVIYDWGKLDKLLPIYSYILVLLLGIIIGFWLSKKINLLINNYKK
jgi:hypothetical protein